MMARNLLLALVALGCMASAEALATIRTDKRCYTTVQPIQVSFTNSAPRFGDRIVITQANNLFLLLSQSLRFSRSGTVTIRQSLTINRQYRARLQRFNGRIEASSDAFTVSRVCTPPAPPPPTPKPTPPPPTQNPTFEPTSSPTAPLPTAGPTIPVTNMPSRSESRLFPETRAALEAARERIIQMLNDNARMFPMLLRLGFHDCVGGVCDGCVDLTNPDNFGLEPVIEALSALDEFATEASNVTRADLWHHAVFTAADVISHGFTNRPVSFKMRWFGRVNCEDANTECFNRFGEPQPCNATRGPHRALPMKTLNHDQLFSFFNESFGFNKRQTVAIMGCHVLGRLVTSESGVNGPNGWVFDNTELKNEYYQALLGSADASSTKQGILSGAPRWRKFHQDNSAIGMDDTNYFTFNAGGRDLVMLPVDIALIRETSPANTNPVTGEVNCTIQTSVGRPLCPIARTIKYAMEFLDNDAWLEELGHAMDIMLSTGYDKVPCDDDLCLMTPK